MIARNITVWSLLALLIFSASFFAPVFFGNLTVSPFDLCYFAMPAMQSGSEREQVQFYAVNRPLLMCCRRWGNVTIMMNTFHYPKNILIRSNTLSG